MWIPVDQLSFAFKQRTLQEIVPIRINTRRDISPLVPQILPTEYGAVTYFNYYMYHCDYLCEEHE